MDKEKKYYAVSMLPYPSGHLHMGHVRNYTINDILARQKRMNGYNVLMPMGWDAFGLPAENAALKNGVPPAQWTRSNIEHMKSQLKKMNLSIDWGSEIATCDPSYYKHTQSFFLKMLEDGVIERRTQTVNWDPVDKTVLANEQVIDGKGWRTGAVVEKRKIPGYYFKITEHAERLLNDLNELKGWPERVKLMQSNWIGKSEGASINWETEQGDKIKTFTTHPETLMGVTFCAISASHPMAIRAIEASGVAQEMVRNWKAITEAEISLQEKEGFFSGMYVRHPISGSHIPVWVANYVIDGYGESAVMGVPAHDVRDFEFAQKYDLQIKQVFTTKAKNEVLPLKISKGVELFAINSGVFNGLVLSECLKAIVSSLVRSGYGKEETTFRLRDWGISRQRYWGTPIPMVNCDDCGPVAEKDLPVILPEGLIPDGTGNPLEKCSSFINTPCPCCGKPAKRETDTMDTFVDSSWYFMRYGSPKDKNMVGEDAKYWMSGGVDQYIGGIEHAILHLLYARYFTKLMNESGLIDETEPFKDLLCQGMVLNHAFARRGENGVNYFWPKDLDIIKNEDGTISHGVSKHDGLKVDYLGVTTMSKSKNNGVDPDDLIDKYGSDVVKFYTMFAAPPEQDLEWSEEAVEGGARFIKKISKFTKTFTPSISAGKSVRKSFDGIVNQCIVDYESLKYNTVASGCMKLMNLFEQNPKEITSDMFEDFLKLLHPICPVITKELWATFMYAGEIETAVFPEKRHLEENKVVQMMVDGKKRGEICIEPTWGEEERLINVKNHSFFMGKAINIKKVVFVPGKVINIVTAPVNQEVKTIHPIEKRK